MRVKRYVVDSMPEAMEKIKTELGTDAIILNTKPIKRGGLFGLFGKQQIEVIAAVDQRTAEREPKQPGTRAVPTAANFAAKQAYQRTAATSHTHTPAPSVPSDNSRLQPEPIAAHAEVTSPEPPVPSQAAKREGPAAEMVRDEPQPEMVKPPEMKPSGQASYDQQIASELRDMREMVQKLLMLREHNSHLPEPFVAVRDRLLKQHVNDELVAQIMGDLLGAAPDPANLNGADAVKRVRTMIEELLQQKQPLPARIDRSVKFAFFFGPTGVGKTTTIAKLAAESMLRDKRKVGFITSDTFRIAAVEQLKTYANILNVPFEVVFTPKDMAGAIDRLGSCDLILVDTAGRNYRNDEYVRSMKELLRYGETAAHFLVLSLTTNYTDMKAILENFGSLPSGRAIFTKADETAVYGPILNVVHEFDLALSYITTGQNVPDDIILATPEIVAKMIMGDDSDG
ncbi:flagellar biosynthesis protein FlhF [Brevibacillus fulvus]|uniref:Flagellar biosynthesis protein FlhF n=1 Tax=Brevibacillus fulvus TaxID=1125967 RepID=A0A938Y1B9_9BACL|nr:flagellar biosynthesis protein FlhF [Brevibacillus fulvus]